MAQEPSPLNDLLMTAAARMKSDRADERRQEAYEHVTARFAVAFATAWFSTVMQRKASKRVQAAYMAGGAVICATGAVLALQKKDAA